jgi:hypothetical protein
MTNAIILSIAILFAVFSSDLGRRAITTRRLLRPLLVAGGAGALFLSAVATSGDGLAIELAGLGAGAVLGLFAASFMRVDHDQVQGTTFTQAGIGYALIWVTTIAARLAFIYGTEHWFSQSLNSWLLAHQITGDALTDAVVVMALAMTTARTLSLLARSHRAGGGRVDSIRTADSVG